MSHSKLSDHVFKKGKFITPFHSLPAMQELEDEKSWTYGRMPEYIWIGLLLNFYGREDGLKKCYYIIKALHEIAPELKTARLSQILKLDKDSQKRFYENIVFLGGREALAPLTIILTISRAPIFAECFFCAGRSVEDRREIIVNTMHDLMDHQSLESTDIRFIALYFSLLSGNIHLLQDQIDLLLAYPKSKHEDEIMKMARPFVRAMEQMILTFENTDSDYLREFWRCISEMTECNLYTIVYPVENRNITAYMEKLYSIFSYFVELFTAADPLDDKMKVLLGIATYSYKRLKETYEHHLFNAISGRSCVRVLIEDYIMMKYLVKNETHHTNIWRDYQIYGMGLYKLVLARYRENPVSGEHHFDEKYVETLVNEYTNEEFIDMDTKYFDKQNVRLKAESVDEKDLFGLYYDYDSSFEHGLWGSIRESALLKCTNPAHQYHCVPDVNDKIILNTVMPDCIMIMNKTVSFLNELYGVPDQLLNEVMNFEIESIVG